MVGPSSSSASGSAIRSSSSTWRGRDCSWRNRCLIALVAIVRSQFDGFRGGLLAQRAIRVQEGRLRDVLGVRVISEDRERIAIDLAAVAAVEVVEGAPRGGRIR